MNSFLDVLQTLMICVTLLGLAFIVLLSLPQSQLRTFLLPIIGWGMAIFCAVYAISPVDFCPEIALGPLGALDDLAVAAAGITAARIAMASSKTREKSKQC